MESNEKKVLHPWCPRCGWRKGGIDSWDGKRCKCGEYEPPMRPLESELVPITGSK